MIKEIDGILGRLPEHLVKYKDPHPSELPPVQSQELDLEHESQESSKKLSESSEQQDQ